MRINSITVDDFYINPWEVRNFALNQEFAVRGNYPGQRTVSFLNDSLKETIQSIILPHAGKVTYWSEDQYTGSFQYTITFGTTVLTNSGAGDFDVYVARLGI